MKYTAFIVFLILSISIYAFAEIFEVKITGIGAIQSGDTVKARDDAFNDALNNAIKKGVEKFVSDQTIAESSRLLEDKIYSRLGGYIKSIEIVDEEVSTELANSYEIIAKASIVADKLTGDLADLGLLKITKDKNAPLVLVFIQEKNIDNVHWHFQTKTFNYTENTVIDVMNLKGFEFVEQSILMQDLTPDEERAFYSEDLINIINIGNKHNAYIIITGKSISRASKNNRIQNGDVLIQASVNLEAIQVNNGKLIASGSGVSELVHSEELIGGSLALKEAAQKATHKLISDLTSPQSENIITGIKVTLIVSGLKSIEDLIQFRREFKNRAGPLKSIERRTFTGGTAAFDLVSNSDGVVIASKLTSKGLDSFDVDIRSQSPNYLELNLKLK